MQPAKKILICGLPGVGKTSLGKELAKRLQAVHFDGDEVRDLTDNTDFTLAGRIRQARRMSQLSDIATRAGHFAIASFICPTREAREVFGAGFVIWIDRPSRAYTDTEALWEPPGLEEYDLVVRSDRTPAQWCQPILNKLLGASVRPWDDLAATGLVVGRFQPFHDGHRALAVEAIRRLGQVLIGVRQQPLNGDNPFSFEQIAHQISEALAEHRGKYRVLSLPNLTQILYGRLPGYLVQQIQFAPHIEAISGKAIRRGGEEGKIWGEGDMGKARDAFPNPPDRP